MYPEFDRNVDKAQIEDTENHVNAVNETPVVKQPVMTATEVEPFAHAVVRVR